jgi:hypothetical protein
MTYAELREEFLTRLAAELDPLRFRRRQQSYKREAGDRRQVLHLSFVKHPAGFEVTADVALRLHAVEERRPDRMELPIARRRETATIGAELGNLHCGEPKRWRVECADDIPPIVTDVMHWLALAGTPFFERFATDSAVLATLERDDRQARLICPIPGVRHTVRKLLRAQIDAPAG